MCLLDFKKNIFALVFAITLPVQAGPYSEAKDDDSNAYDSPIAGWLGPDGVGFAHVDPWYPHPDNFINDIFIDWASSVVDYYTPGGVDVGWDDPTYALGPASGNEIDVVSLGEMNETQIATYIADPAAVGIAVPGYIVLYFDTVIGDGDGADFAVFENGFSVGSDAPFFAELAYVEVSSDGVNFARFNSVSLTDEPDPDNHRYMSLDPTEVYNLAGKHVNAHGYCWGTPFDLSRLSQNPLVTQGIVNLNDIRYVRIVDIPGDGSFTDSAGNPIYDAWPTYGSGGFDLDAVGVINTAAQAIIIGDANRDGQVNIYDFLILRSNYGSQTAAFYDGDFDGDRDVDIFDFLLLRSNYGYGSN